VVVDADLGRLVLVVVVHRLAQLVPVHVRQELVGLLGAPLEEGSLDRAGATLAAMRCSRGKERAEQKPWNSINWLLLRGTVSPARMRSNS
jgi:hypothetical protein